MSLYVQLYLIFVSKQGGPVHMFYWKLCNKAYINEYIYTLKLSFVAGSGCSKRLHIICLPIIFMADKTIRILTPDKTWSFREFRREEYELQRWASHTGFIPSHVFRYSNFWPHVVCWLINTVVWVFFWWVADFKWHCY